MESQEIPFFEPKPQAEEPYMIIKVSRQKFWYTISSVLVLCLLLLSTALILKTSGDTKCDQIQIPTYPSQRIQPEVSVEISEIDSRVHVSEETSTIQSNRKRPCRPGSKKRHCQKENEDEKVLEEKPIDCKLGPKLIGKYHQVSHDNMEKYLDVEGGSWMFKRMALSAKPNLEIIQYSDNEYGQIYTAPFYRQEYPMKFGVEYDLQDGLGTPVKATASDKCDEIEIVAEGGKQGQQITRLVLNSESGELKMYMTLKKHNVTAARIFQIDTA